MIYLLFIYLFTPPTPPSYKNHLLQEPPSKLRRQVVLVTRGSDNDFFAVIIRNSSRKYKEKIANFSFPIQIRRVFQGGEEVETSTFFF